MQAVCCNTVMRIITNRRRELFMEKDSVKNCRKSKTSNVKKTKITKNVLQLISLEAIPFLFVFVFSYIPMFGIIIAFKDYKYRRGILGSNWVGLKNFDFLFKSNDFIYKKKFKIKTKDYEREYTIISKSYDYLLCIDGTKIYIKDIIDIK